MIYYFKTYKDRTKNLRFEQIFIDDMCERAGYVIENDLYFIIEDNKTASEWICF